MLLIQGLAPHLALAALLMEVALSPAAGTSTDPIVVLRDVTVVPVSEPGVLRHQTIVIEGDRIARVGPLAEVAVPQGARVVEGRGRTVIPGLCDMHSHLPRGEEYDPELDDFLALNLAAGVTTIRTMRGASGDVELRDAIAAGERLGPRIVACSPAINGEAAPTPEAGVERVRQYAAEGFDTIKVTGGFSTESFLALAAETRRQGLPLAGHLPQSVSLDQALAAPFASLEHLHGHGPAMERAPQEFAALAQRTAAAGVWSCPTLGFQLSWYGQVEVAEAAAWPGMRYAPPASLEYWAARVAERLAVDAPTRELNTRRYAAHEAAARALGEAGVGLLVSPSGGYYLVPGFSMGVELRALVAAGLSNADVLEAATLAAARFLGEDDDWGAVRPGLRADLVLIDGNPLEDITACERVEAVVVRGRLLDRSELEASIAHLLRPAPTDD